MVGTEDRTKLPAKAETSGKEDRLYYTAQKLYVEDLKTIPQLQKLLPEYVSEVTLRKWKDKGDWDRLRKEYMENVKSLPDRVRGIAAKVIAEIERKHGGNINTADMDMLAKANKIIQEHRDPRDVLAIAIQMISEFGGLVMAKAPEAAPVIAPLIDEFLIRKREESNV